MNRVSINQKPPSPPHFQRAIIHSPIVDPQSVTEYVKRERTIQPGELKGIDIDLGGMVRLWEENLAFIQTSPFTELKSEKNRYFYTGGPLPYGDANTLRMMMHHAKPKRVIEVGSGFSSACMLDSAEHIGLGEFQITCIEPYPERLLGLMRPDDSSRVTLLQKPVQDVEASIVDSLDANDILFIDSTHVMKTGSDVHYEFFHLLPRLKTGVLVHFHDVPFPFEYPDKWINELNYSWNEAYALRAFLMYNNDFKILFWPGLFAYAFRAKIADEFQFSEEPRDVDLARQVLKESGPIDLFVTF